MSFEREIPAIPEQNQDTNLILSRIGDSASSNGGTCPLVDSDAARLNIFICE
jgi:hypothetical protein